MGPRKLQVAVAGLGRMGARHALHFLNLVPRAELVAAFTPDDKEVAWAQTALAPSGVTIYKDYDEMLKHEGLEAVVIATVTTVHAEQAIKGIQAGKHVLCEKPLSTSVDVSQSVVNAAAKRPDLKVICGFSRRFDASYRDAWERMDAGSIGRPSVFRSQTCDKLDPSGFFVAYAEFSGGIFVDCNIHDIDLALWFLGQDSIVKSVHAVGITAVQPDLRKHGDVDNGVGLVEFWGGKIAYFYSSRMMASGQHDMTEIIGTGGKLVVNANPNGGLVDLWEETGIRREIPQHYYGRFAEAFVTEANEFTAAVLDGGKLPFKLSGAVQAVTIGCALQESLRSGKKIDFDETGRRIERASLYCLRRAAIRVISSSPSSALTVTAKPRSITTLSPSLLRQPRFTLSSQLQRRFASDESNKFSEESLQPEPTQESAAAEPAFEAQEEPTSTLSSAETSAADSITAADAEQDGAAVAAASAAASAAGPVDDRPYRQRAPRTGSRAGGPPSVDPSSMLYVGNLFFDVTEEDLKREFSRFGNVERTKLIYDNRGLSKGFGYVQLGSIEAASEALDAMNQQIYQGRRMNIQFAQRRVDSIDDTGPTRRSKPQADPAKTLFIGNLAFEMTDTDLNNLFKGIRNIVDVRVAIDRRTGQPRGFAHADFMDVASATAAMKTLKEKEVYGRRLRVDFSDMSQNQKDRLRDGGRDGGRDRAREHISSEAGQQ